MSTTQLVISARDRVVDLVTTTEGQHHVSTLNMREPGQSRVLLYADVDVVPVTLTRWRKQIRPDSEAIAHARALASLEDFFHQHPGVAQKFLFPKVVT